MKYIIMCGGNYEKFKEPRWLIKVHGEVLLERTIRLLHELGVEEIYISSNFPDHFKYLGLPILIHQNSYKADKESHLDGYWVDAFVPLSMPACYLCGDVWYSKEALEKIVNTEAKDILFFGTQEPFARGYNKSFEEPLAFKVVDQKKFRECIDKVKYLQDNHLTNRLPISWELYRVIDGIDPNEHRLGKRFIGIHDFALDIDSPGEVKNLEEAIDRNLGILE